MQNDNLYAFLLEVYLFGILWLDLFQNFSDCLRKKDKIGQANLVNETLPINLFVQRFANVHDDLFLRRIWSCGAFPVDSQVVIRALPSVGSTPQLQQPSAVLCCNVSRHPFWELQRSAWTMESADGCWIRQNRTGVAGLNFLYKVSGQNLATHRSWQRTGTSYVSYNWACW